MVSSRASSRGVDPRELRHSFVSVLSDAGIPVEQIGQLVGHTEPPSPRWSTGTSCVL